MTKVNPRILEETVTTSGHTFEQLGDIINIYTPTGSLAATGDLTQSGRLSLTCPHLHRNITTISELGQTLDTLTSLR